MSYHRAVKGTTPLLWLTVMQFAKELSLRAAFTVVCLAHPCRRRRISLD